MLLSTISVVLFSYFIVLVSPAAVLQGKTSEEVCMEKECYEAGNHIHKWMNPAFNPCDDFYEFSCGYWHTPDNKTLEQGQNSSLNLKGDIVAYHLKRILLDPPGVQDSPLHELLRTFLSLCMDEDAIKARGLTPALNFMKALGGWPLLEDDWQEQNWDLVNAEIFTGILLHVTTMFYDELGKRVIEINVQVPPDYESNVTLTKMVDLAVAFGVSRDKAEQEMNKTLEFVLDLVEIVRDEDYETRLYNISELQDNITWVDWTRLLTGVLPDSMSLADIGPILVEKPKVYKKLEKLLDQHSKRTIANYEMIILAGVLSKYLTPEIANITSPTTKLRYDFCIDVVKESSLDRVAGSYIATATAEDIKLALEITEQLKEELLKNVEDIAWLDEKTRTEAIDKISDLTIIIGLPKSVVDLNTLEELYKEVKIDTANFFEAMVDSDKFRKEEKFRYLSTEEEESDSLTEWLSDVNTFYGPLAFYSPIMNFIVVSSGFLHLIPLFNAKLPLYINYGLFGYVIAHELTHALDVEPPKDEDEEFDREVDDGGFLLRWGSNATKEIYEEKKQCIIEQYTSFNDTRYTKLQLNGTFTQDEDVADNGGFKLALRAYRRVTDNLLAPEPRLPLLEKYSPEQLFMISAANFYCEIPTWEKRKSLLNQDSHTFGDFRVRGIMMNSPDFSKSYHCTVDDNMNPNKKCEVW